MKPLTKKELYDIATKQCNAICATGNILDINKPLDSIYIGNNRYYLASNIDNIIQNALNALYNRQ